jgi:hypothetical protein
MTKDEEIDAIRSLVECLGPDSYLGPWLHDALPFLADCITCDLPPLSAAELQQQATVDRIAAHCLKQEAQMECRQLLDSTNRRADAPGPIRSQPDGCAVPGSLHPSSISSPLMSCAKAAMPSGPIRSLSQ